MKRNSGEPNLYSIDVPDDFWLPEEDMLLLHDACTKKPKIMPLPDQRSAEWKELTTEVGACPCYIKGVVVQVFKGKKDRWTKIYVKRGEDIGVCLLDNRVYLDNIKIGTGLFVWIRNIFNIDEDRDISKVICTCKFGIIADPEIVIESPKEPHTSLANPAENMCLSECYDNVQSTKSFEYQVRVSVVWAGEQSSGKKKKPKRRSIIVRDCKGMAATMVINTEIEGLEAGRELVISGFNIEFERGSFKITMGPDSAIQVCGMSTDVTVPSGSRTRSIESIRSVLESKTGPFEDVYEIEGLITQLALKRSVYGICSACGTWQVVLNRKRCKKCGPADFVKLKFDICMSMADESGEWSDLRLKDPLASMFLRNTPYECRLAETEQEMQLSWVKATVKVSLTYDCLKSTILDIRESNPNVM